MASIEFKWDTDKLRGLSDEMKTSNDYFANNIEGFREEFSVLENLGFMTNFLARTEAHFKKTGEFGRKLQTKLVSYTENCENLEKRISIIASDVKNPKFSTESSSSGRLSNFNGGRYRGKNDGKTNSNTNDGKTPLDDKKITSITMGLISSVITGTSTSLNIEIKEVLTNPEQAKLLHQGVSGLVASTGLVKELSNLTSTEAQKQANLIYNDGETTYKIDEQYKGHFKQFVDETATKVGVSSKELLTDEKHAQTLHDSMKEYSAAHDSLKKLSELEPEKLQKTLSETMLKEDGTIVTGEEEVTIAANQLNEDLGLNENNRTTETTEPNRNDSSDGNTEDNVADPSEGNHTNVEGNTTPSSTNQNQPNESESNENNSSEEGEWIEVSGTPEDSESAPNSTQETTNSSVFFGLGGGIAAGLGGKTSSTFNSEVSDKKTIEDNTNNDSSNNTISLNRNNQEENKINEITISDYSDASRIALSLISEEDVSKIVKKIYYYENSNYVISQNVKKILKTKLEFIAKQNNIELNDLFSEMNKNILINGLKEFGNQGKVINVLENLSDEELENTFKLVFNKNTVDYTSYEFSDFIESLRKHIEETGKDIISIIKDKELLSKILMIGMPSIIITNEEEIDLSLTFILLKGMLNGIAKSNNIELKELLKVISYQQEIKHNISIFKEAMNIISKLITNDISINIKKLFDDKDVSVEYLNVISSYIKYLSRKESIVVDELFYNANILKLKEGLNNFSQSKEAFNKLESLPNDKLQKLLYHLYIKINENYSINEYIKNIALEKEITPMSLLGKNVDILLEVV